MSDLTYTKQVTTSTTKTVEVAIRVPKTFGMYTSGGNRSIRLKAERLVRDMQAAPEYLDKLKAFQKYFTSFKKMYRSKTMGEAGDTDVRDQVWGFAVEVGEAVRVDRHALDGLWENTKY